MNPISLEQGSVRVPSKPGIYGRLAAGAPFTLVHVSVENFFDGTYRASITDLTPHFVPGAVPYAKQVLTSKDDEDKPGGGLGLHFIGPMKLYTDEQLAAALAAPPVVPTSTGLYVLAQHLGHAWFTQVINLRCHRYSTGDGEAFEWFAHSLPHLEEVCVQDLMPTPHGRFSAVRKLIGPLELSFTQS